MAASSNSSSNPIDWQTSGPFRLDVTADFRPLHEALQHAGFSQMSIIQLTNLLSSDNLDVQLTLRRTEEPTPLNLLVRLFVLNRPVRRDLLEPVLAPMSLEPLLACGVLQADGDQIRSVPVLLPMRETIVLYDPGFELSGAEVPADYVVGVGRSTLVVSSMTPKSPAGTCLDLGTGQGFQALRAAAHHQQVIATDVNPRALNYAAMAAKMNGLTNIDFRLGSMFEPVAGMTFDRIISNPPYVISPSSELVFRDSGRGSDNISREIIEGIPERLNPDGMAVVIFNWHHESDEHWHERPVSWVVGKHCDVWFLKFETKEPIIYASEWLKELEERAPERYGRMLDEWMQYYEREGIKRISGGLLVLRKRTSGRPWVQAHAMPDWPQLMDCSAQMERIFKAHDILEQVGGEAGLLNVVLQLVPEHILEHRQQLQEGNWQTRTATLRLTEGLPFSGNIDGLVANILELCDGKRTLGEALQLFAQRLNIPLEKVVPAATKVMCRLLETGLVHVPTVETTASQP